MLGTGTDTAYGPLAGGTIRVLSWNLWWRFGPWEERLPAILETVAALEPDICCFQEVWVDRNLSPEDSLPQRIEQRLGEGYQHCGAHRIEIEGVLWVNAILSRWPIVSSAVLDLPAPDASQEMRTCVRADISSAHGDLQVFCTHLNWRFDESHVRQEQVRAICRFVADSPPRTYPPILCGDLNAAPDSDEMRMLTGRAAVPVEKLVFHDAWEVAGAAGDPGFTWSNDNPHAALDLEPSRRIDYVLAGWPKAGGRGQVVGCEVVGVDAVGGVVPSDHYGVLATLRA